MSISHALALGAEKAIEMSFDAAKLIALGHPVIGFTILPDAWEKWMVMQWQ